MALYMGPVHVYTELITHVRYGILRMGPDQIHICK